MAIDLHLARLPGEKERLCLAPRGDTPERLFELLPLGCQSISGTLIRDLDTNDDEPKLLLTVPERDPLRESYVPTPFVDESGGSVGKPGPIMRQDSQEKDAWEALQVPDFFHEGHRYLFGSIRLVKIGVE